jgi:MFS family permease
MGLGLGYVFAAIWFGMPLVVRNYAGALVAALFHPFMQALSAPAYHSLVSKAVPEERRGIAFGLITTSRALIAIPIPLLGGYLWERFSPDTPFWVTVAGCFALSLLAFWKLRVGDK